MLSMMLISPYGNHQGRAHPHHGAHSETRTAPGDRGMVKERKNKVKKDNNCEQCRRTLWKWGKIMSDLETVSFRGKVRRK